MFEKFNAAGRRTVILAQEEARMLNHGQVGPEHLILGAFYARDSAAHAVLEEAALTLDAVREVVKALAPVASETLSGPIPFTPPARRALEKATSLAGEVRTPVDPDLILLGVLDTAAEEDLALRMLAAINLPAGPLRLRLNDITVTP